MVNIDTSTEVGRRLTDRLHRERIAWLVTVDADGTPQPSPVWFLWTGSEFLIFSRRDKRKLHNIAHNSAVAVHLNSSESGQDIVVFSGTARLTDTAPSDAERDAYNRKYEQDILRIGFTPTTFAETYSVPLRVIPTKLRG